MRAKGRSARLLRHPGAAVRVRRVQRQAAHAHRRAVLRAVPGGRAAARDGAQPSQARLHGLRVAVHAAAARALQPLEEGDAVDQAASERCLRRGVAERAPAEHPDGSDDHAHEAVGRAGGANG